MTTLSEDLLTSAEWRRRIDDLVERHHVPGVQVGVIAVGTDGEVDLRTTASGVTSRSTGVEVTPQTIFQWGSITKVWTTTLVMQLVDEGLLNLDARIVDLLDDFTIADRDLAAEITVRHLLDHTSGIDGDIFTDTGDGDDCVARYVDALRTAVSVTRPGGPLSYCNAGFVVAGRLVEVLRGTTWDEALAEHLLRPLGLRHTITKAKDAPLFRAAVGHLKTESAGGDVVPTTTWMLPRSMGPAGLIAGSVTDLLSFAAVHLRDGIAPDGTRVLSAGAARLMREPQVDLSAVSTTQRGWGLGWSLVGWGDETAASHGGGTIGQIADLHLFPDRGLALAVLTNSSTGPALVKELLGLLADELGLTAPAPRTEPGAEQEDLSSLVGRWESSTARWEIAPVDGGLQLTMTTAQEIADEPDPEPQLMRPTGPGRFLIAPDGIEIEVSHLRADGREYLYATRLLERVHG
jgi:CubicO group peptidase (beta-lactamase class C family)